MNTNDELTAAVEKSAGEIRELLRSVLDAVPHSAIDDRINTYTVLQRTARLLRGRHLKRRALPPVEGSTAGKKK